MHNPYIEIKLIYGSMLNLSCGGGYLGFPIHIKIEIL